jgi:hypothetical protein
MMIDGDRIEISGECMRDEEVIGARERRSDVLASKDFRLISV